MDKWLKSLNMTVQGLPNYREAEPNVERQFRDLVKVDDEAGSDSDVTITTKVFSSDPDDADIPDPTGAVIRKAQNDALRKRSGVSDESWDAPLGKAAATTLSPERSRARFAKVSESLKKLFKDSPEYLLAEHNLCRRGTRRSAKTIGQEQRSSRRRCA
jgi:hypothetical protein